MGINTPGVQDLLHKDKKKKENDDTKKIADGYIPEEDVHHLQITSKNECRIYNLRSIKPGKHPGVDNYAHAQIVHYAMT